MGESITDYEYGQRVMAAAGVVPDVVVGGIVTPMRGKYPDPLTPAGFCALWDALEAKGFEADITFDQGDKLHCAVIYTTEDGRTWDAQATHANRAAALLEAAAQALGVPRG